MRPWYEQPVGRKKLRRRAEQRASAIRSALVKGFAPETVAEALDEPLDVVIKIWDDLNEHKETA